MYVGKVKLAVLSFFSFFFLLEEKRFINHHRPDHRIWTIPIDKPEMSSPNPLSFHLLSLSTLHAYMQKGPFGPCAFPCLVAFSLLLS